MPGRTSIRSNWNRNAGDAGIRQRDDQSNVRNSKVLTGTETVPRYRLISPAGCIVFSFTFSAPLKTLSTVAPSSALLIFSLVHMSGMRTVTTCPDW